MRVLFMGTPEFAAICLDRLMREKDLAITVVTTPDKAQGRHMTPTPSAVKKRALEGGLTVFQPATLKDGAFAETLRAIDPEIVIVVAYGKILPGYILDYPKYRCINLHGSLLPAYRGAAPMQRAVIAGEKIVGVTTMYMEKGLDTGDMLERWSAPLGENDDFGVVHDLLAVNGAELLVSTLRKAQAGTLSPEKQDDAAATYAAKIEKADGAVDFSLPARQVHNLVRGLSPTPLAFAQLRGKLVKFIKTTVEEETGCAGQPGTVVSIDRAGVVVSCGEGLLRIVLLRPEGKGTMPASDLAKGRGIAVGDRFLYAL